MQQTNRHVSTALLVLALAWLASCSPVSSSPDDAAIRQQLRATWEKPGAPLDVGPIVVAGAHAVVGWTQGTMGGRALLERTGKSWSVVLCAGDLLKSEEGLRSSGVPSPQATELAIALRRAEADIPESRLALMASFNGLVQVKAGADHAPDHAVASGMLRIERAWARATPPGATEGVVYLQIHNDGAADELVGMQSSASEAAMLHRSTVDPHGIASMPMIARLDLPAGTSVELEPNGLHVMLSGLRQPLLEGNSVPLTLEFRHAGRRQISAKVAGMGAVAPAGEAMDHTMHH